ncbi:hypothetical protein BT69DRAFT_148201 [Atractiella rhizophila]|nr:hypothetical protein BT69DRAFT_148201 [Atractiella rhizophila]
MRDGDVRAICSNAQIKPCSLLCKQWSELSLPYVDWLLMISVTNTDGIVSFMHQAKASHSHIKHLSVNFPGESQQLDQKANWAALWGALREVLETVGGQLQTMDIVPENAPLLKLVFDCHRISHLWVRTSSGMTNPVLQDWFTGLEECTALRHLELLDVHPSQSSTALFALRSLVIRALLPAEFCSKSYPAFWPTFFRSSASSTPFEN